jgi:hypothetical protein
MIPCWQCAREAETTCTNCERPICPDHTRTISHGPAEDPLKIALCTECYPRFSQPD